MSIDHQKIGLCLSGGGSRGSFHIGVIQALKEENINPVIISGTSAGALTACLFGSGLEPKDLLDFAIHTKWFHFLDTHLPPAGLIDIQKLKQLIESAISIRTFEELKIPIITTATNLYSGTLEYFKNGPLVDPVIASCAIPIVFNPVTIEDSTYLDGGILMNLPAEVIKEQCDFVIASNLIPISTNGTKVMNKFSSIIARVLEINLANNMKNQLPYVDLLIEDQDIIHFSKYDLTNAKELYKLGYQATKKALQNFNMA
ncbi:MAG: patatin-like phospholipase family protein [Saprospiraceae bacterium]|nr:patatin-like phospholipase family protein [Saprospiraceae bacterium]